MAWWIPAILSCLPFARKWQEVFSNNLGILTLVESMNVDVGVGLLLNNLLSIAMGVERVH